MINHYSDIILKPKFQLKQLCSYLINTIIKPHPNIIYVSESICIIIF